MKISVISVGTDIVSISRIKKLINRHGTRFLNRIFTNDEIVYCEKQYNPSIHFAGKFSAKESVLKTLTNSRIRKNIFYRDISILNKDTKKPFVYCKKIDSFKFDLSISHTEEFATSVVVLLND